MSTTLTVPTSGTTTLNPGPVTNEGSSSGSGKLRKWRLSVAGRKRTGWLKPTPSLQSHSTTSEQSADRDGNDPYTVLQVVEEDTTKDGTGTDGGYEWEADSSTEDGTGSDAYSWIDPSIVGSARLRATPAGSIAESDELHSPGTSSIGHALSETHLSTFPTPPDHTSHKVQPRRPKISPSDSYNLLLAYQSSQSTSSSSGRSSQQHPSTAATSHIISPYTSSDGSGLRNPTPDWHDLVDASVRKSLGAEEVKRQGNLWELITGEVEYVRDLRTICQVFIQPLRDQQPPLLIPQPRLDAFITEVFSTIPSIYVGHAKLLDRLMERQRAEWPLVTSVADLFLETFLEIIDLYETYMKNYPFAEARIRRESDHNPAFRDFLAERNTHELTRRRDISSFLQRPISRLPRLILMFQSLVKHTPDGHPDKEQLPMLEQILSTALRGSQLGIESAEAKIKLWNVAERLLFRRGEIIELDVAEPKRTLVHSGYVFRRVRSETNWHGWQDLHAFLLDNYFILARDIEDGKYVVVSRPIHLDFLTIDTADGPPERRYDGMTRYKRRPDGNLLEPVFQPERLMFPFTISTGGTTSRSFTLCTATMAAREQWREKIEGAKTLREFDVESNRMFAVHRLSVPTEIKEPLVAADSFQWLGRETLSVATAKSVWLGWRNDAKSLRELIKLNAGVISSVSIVPDFAQLLVVSSGRLLAFDMDELMSTNEPSTWVQQGGSHATELSREPVAFARVGTTKGRLLVVHAVHSRNSHSTTLHFHEPLLPSARTRMPFRQFATLVVPGFASELAFFKQTTAVVTERTFVVAEPGNPTFNSIPILPPSTATATVARVVISKPLGMYQIAENEFLLVYEAGGCIVTKYGEVARDGACLRWNLTPSYAVFRHPHLLLFDQAGSRVEVRHVPSGRMCEVIEEKGMKPLVLSRVDQALLGLSPGGLVKLVETFEL
ncbi:hypothetical protein BCR39DRAFT_523619 [Naematelia encephala]|uniref:Dbl homology domain-containing protein n=1 Tax=Naematelia encephala TaxID=71784 RepID=A0A1Y2BBP4_9TREE|nr:hypothetical protein BCR39DRAFT_523619 [Naematelia encephala]